MTSYSGSDVQFPEPDSLSPAGARSRVVLVVEDSQDIGAILEAALEEEGLTVYTVRNGREVLDRARELRPDLITLDLGLPGKSGQEVVAELRAEPSTWAIPIVAVSGHTDAIDRSLAAEVARVISKPFYLSDVIDAVLQTLGMETTPGAG